MKTALFMAVILVAFCPFVYSQNEESEISSQRILDDYRGIASGRQVQKYPLRLREDKVLRITLDSKENTVCFMIREEQAQVVVQLETAQWVGRVPKGNYTIDVLLTKRAMDLKQEAEFHLKVEELMSHSTEEPEAKPDSELINTRWKLVQLNGNEIYTPEGGSDIYVTLSPEENKVNGYAGCNNFFGLYEVSENTLHFQRLASTKRACPELDTESEFLSVLESTEEYRIDGERLTVYSDGQPIAVFTALYLQ